jgi:hypothetical protein
MMNWEGYGTLQGATVPEFTWMDWEDPEKALVRIVGARAEHFTRARPNTQQVCALNLHTGWQTD